MGSTTDTVIVSTKHNIQHNITTLIYSATMVNANSDMIDSEIHVKSQNTILVL